MQARALGSPPRLPPQPQPQPQPHPQPQPQIQLQLHLQPLPPPLPPPPPIPSSRLLRRFPVTWPWNMKGFNVVPGTLGSLALRFAQFSAAVVSFAVMISVRDFSTVTAFCFLVAATVLQCLWSLSVAAFEGYAWVLGRSLQDSPLLSLFAVGDWITSIVVFAGACASASIAVLVSRDLRKGCVEVYCGRYAAATGMAFLSWFLILISFLYTFWNLARR